MPSLILGLVQYLKGKAACEDNLSRVPSEDILQDAGVFSVPAVLSGSDGVVSMSPPQVGGGEAKAESKDHEQDQDGMEIFTNSIPERSHVPEEEHAEEEEEMFLDIVDVGEEIRNLWGDQTHENVKTRGLDIPGTIRISDDFFRRFNVCPEREIGVGLSGSVVTVTSGNQPERKFAVKTCSIFIKSSKLKSARTQKAFRMEIQCARQLQHQYIMKEVWGVISPDKLVVINPYYPRGDLFNKIGEEIAPAEACFYFLQLADAVGYLFSKSVAHLDIKPENILLQGSDRILLADFGCAVMLSSQAGTVTKHGGTKDYWPPECFTGVRRKNPFKMDVYASGLVLWTLLFQEKPPGGRGSCLKRIRQDTKNFHSYRMFLELLLKPNPDRRMTMPEFLQHINKTSSGKLDHIYDVMN